MRTFISAYSCVIQPITALLGREEAYEAPRRPPALFEFYTSCSFMQPRVSGIKYVADENEEEQLNIEGNILVIETSEGVFIRAHTTQWCKRLTGVASEKAVPLKIIGVKKWTEITRKYRAPINSYGDNKLAVWRVGF